MNKRDKRGLSLVITSLIIILLVLVAAGIIWVVVRNIMQRGVEQIDYNTKCFDVNIEAKNVVNTGMTNYSITLTRTASGDAIAGIKLLFFNATADTSDVIDVPGNIAPLATVTKNVDGEILNSNKVEVTAYFEDESGNEKLCSQTTSFSIKAVEGEENGNGEPCIPDSDPCGDWVCGNVENGTCGTISCPPGCTGTDICTNGVCVPEECVNETLEETCGTWVCGNRTNNCGYIVDCGTCPSGTCVEGACIIETSVNTGTVGSVWPSGVGLYFDSEDLPKSGVDYFGYYINFTGAETDCLLIAGYFIPTVPEVYNLTHIRFNFPTDIATNNNYEIWESETCGA